MSSSLLLVVPSNITDVSYLYYPLPLPFVLSDDGGKWLLFQYKGELLDDLWHNFQNLLPMEGILYGKVSTARPFPHGGYDKNLGVVTIYTYESPFISILDLGRKIIALLTFASPIGKIIYKQTSSSLQKHTDYFLPTAMPARRIEEEKKSKKSMLFDVIHGKEFAQQLGAVWDAPNKKWRAPTEAIWAKMNVYWKQAQPLLIAQFEAQKLLSPRNHNICVYSINVWLNLHHHIERMLGIFESVQQARADVLCLQEMTLETYGVLDPLLQTLGYKTESRLYNKTFGEMIYINTNTLVPIQFEQRPLAPKATCGRELHIYHVRHKLSGFMFACATAHLETGKERHQMREKQIHSLWFALQASHLPWVFAGDVNIPYYQEDHLALPDTIHDAWEQTGSKKHLFGTWNPHRNTHLLNNTTFCSVCAPCRYDRILYTCDSFKAVHFQLTCEDPIPLIAEHASDHFGILTKLYCCHPALTTPPILTTTTTIAIP